MWEGAVCLAPALLRRPAVTGAELDLLHPEMLPRVSPPSEGFFMGSPSHGASPAQARQSACEPGGSKGGTRLLSVAAAVVMRELEAAGVLQLACRTAEYVEEGDIELAQLYAARFGKVSPALGALDAMVHSSTMVHLSFWRPLSRSWWAAHHPGLTARLMCNPASYVTEGSGDSSRARGGCGSDSSGGAARVSFRVASEMVVRKLRLCLLDEPSLSLALVLEPLQLFAAALRPVALRYRDVVAAFSQGV